MSKQPNTFPLKYLFSIALSAFLTAALMGCGKGTDVTSSVQSKLNSSSASSVISSQASSAGEENSSTAEMVSSSTVPAASAKASSAAVPAVGSAPANTVKVGYSIENAKALKNFTYTTEAFKDGKTVSGFRVFVNEKRSKVEWLFENGSNIIGTIQYFDTSDKHLNDQYYKQLRFHSSPPGADTGYKGKNLVSAYHIWERHDVTALLNGSSAVKSGTATAEGLPVTVYTVPSGGLTHKIYYNEQHKVWLKYEILSGSTVKESYLTKGFKVGGVTDEQTQWQTKMPGKPNDPGYALMDISGMSMITESAVADILKDIHY